MPLTEQAEQELAIAKNVPRKFKKEIHNAAAWTFLPCTSMSIEPAAKFLGLGFCTFLKHVDTFGLTVLYRNRKGKSGRVDRYFLLSELRPLKLKLESVSGKDALRSAEVADGYFRKDQKKTKIRRTRKGRTR